MSQRLSDLLRETEMFHVKIPRVTSLEKTRVCKLCRRQRHISLFRYKTGDPKRLYGPTCELCRSEQKRSRKIRLATTQPSHNQRRFARLDLPEIIRLRARQMWSGARTRAWRYGLDFALCEAWIAERLASGRCEVTGIPFDMRKGIRRQCTSPSIDRRDPAAGYTQANCRIVIWTYNAAKTDGTDEDVLRMARALLARARVTEPASTQDSHLS